MHAGHAGARDGRGHFRLRIVCRAFAGLRPLQRHQLVYRSLGELMQTDIHALSITALTPEEAAPKKPAQPVREKRRLRRQGPEPPGLLRLEHLHLQHESSHDSPPSSARPRSPCSPLLLLAACNKAAAPAPAAPAERVATVNGKALPQVRVRPVRRER